MTEQQAKTVRQGDTVIYRGQPHRVNSVKTSGIWAPQFRLTNLETGEGQDLTSYRIVSLPQDR